MKLRNSIKEFPTDQEKLFSPGETIENALGAIRKLKPPLSVKLRRIDGCDRLNMPVYLCELKAISKKAYPQKGCFRHKTYGKGVDAVYSKASALMETIERFGCNTFIEDRTNFQTFNYDEAGNKLALESSLLPVSPAFVNDEYILSALKKCRISWVKAFSLTRNRHILLPAFFIKFTTNGYAAGNSLEEAILQGLCEVIERHCIQTITLHKIVTRSINIDSIQNDIAKKIIFNFRKAGIDLYIKDFSSGFKISTIGIMAHDRKGPGIVKFYCAAGTSVNKNTALIRALNEISQHRAQALFLKGLGQTAAFPFYKNLADAAYFTDSTETVKFSELPTYSDNNFRVEIEWAVEELRLAGFEVIAVKATHRCLKIPTVMMTVPGIDYKVINPYLLLAGHYWKLKDYSRATRILERFFRHYPGQYRRGKKFFLPLYFELRKKSGIPPDFDVIY